MAFKVKKSLIVLFMWFAGVAQSQAIADQIRLVFYFG
jgi:hypothetical protein